MDILKPTVLDAARIANEISLLRDAVITDAGRDEASELRLFLRNPDRTIQYSAQRRFAFIGLCPDAPQRDLDPVRPLHDYKIINAEQLGGDRIVLIYLQKEDRLGRTSHAKLILELIPNRGNAVLVDLGGKVKWALRKVETGQYELPAPLKKPTIFNFDGEQLSTKIASPPEIKEHLFGLNARDLKNLNLDGIDSINAALDAIRDYAARAKIAGPAWIIYKGGDLIAYSLVPPAFDPDESAEKIESALEMYPRYYKQASGQAEEAGRLESLQKILERELARERAKLSSIKQELNTAADAALFRRIGELILANIDNVPRGAAKISLPNFQGNQPAEIEIELDPSKNAAANAAEYFKRSKKAASSLNVLSARLESTQKRILELEAANKEKALDSSVLESRLIQLKLLSGSSRARRKKKVEPRLPYKRYWSSSGWEILVGRTNKDNDELTFKIAAKDDYWFHAWQAAGSHTILKLPNRQAKPDKRTLLEAAALASYFSKARNSSKVAIAYTQVKFVRKPKNFPPGKVLVEKEKQLMVSPANPDDYTKPKSD